MRSQPHPIRPRFIRRGYALLLVALVGFMAALAISILIERGSITTLSGRRQMDSYKQHHFAASVKEMTSRWIGTVRGSVNSSIDEDGVAFTLELPDNSTIRVSMDDGQGSVLSDLSQLSGEELEVGARTVEYLRELAAASPGGMPEGWLRPVGPQAVSIGTAPREVIEAIVHAVVDADIAAEATTAILNARDTGALTDAELFSSLSTAEVPEDQIAVLRELLTLVPTLYIVDAERTDSRGAIIQSGRGYRLTEPQRRGDSFNQSAGFLTWDDTTPGSAR